MSQMSTRSAEVRYRSAAQRSATMSVRSLTGRGPVGSDECHLMRAAAAAGGSTAHPGMLHWCMLQRTMLHVAALQRTTVLHLACCALQRTTICFAHDTPSAFIAECSAAVPDCTARPYLKCSAQFTADGLDGFFVLSCVPSAAPCRPVPSRACRQAAPLTHSNERTV